jgi:transposase
MHQHRHEAGEYRRIEVITGAVRRRRWAADEKAEIVAESLQPGMNVSELARRRGVNRGLLQTWRREAMREATDRGGLFVPLRMRTRRRRLRPRNRPAKQPVLRRRVPGRASSAGRSRSRAQACEFAFSVQLMAAHSALCSRMSGAARDPGRPLAAGIADYDGVQTSRFPQGHGFARGAGHAGVNI